MRTLDDLVSAGKVRHIGLSDTPAWYAARAQTIAEYRNYEPISALQLEYSLVERNIERELIPLGQQLGMGTSACINHMKEYLLFTLSPFRFEQMIDQTITCLNQAYIHQLKITDPSMLHMANLLITEIQYPNPLSKQFVYSITTVLITNSFLYLKS